MHAYIRCVAAAAAGNNGDCTVVLGTAPFVTTVLKHKYVHVVPFWFLYIPDI